MPEFSVERCAHALDVIIRANIMGNRKLSDYQRLIFAIGTLMCGDDGKVTYPMIDAGMKDPSVRQVALNLLAKAGKK